MRLVVQRVARASVTVEGQVVGAIGQGFLALVGVGKGDTEAEARFLAEKLANMRVFEDEAGKMNRSLLDVGGAVLAVSQFTLYGDTRKGRRPSFDAAAPPEAAKALYERFVALLQAQGLTVATGVFQAHMLVELANDGPVTFVMERAPGEA